MVCFFCVTWYHVQMISNNVSNCKQVLKDGTQLGKEQIAILMAAIEELGCCDIANVHQGEAIEEQIHHAQAQEVRNAVDQAESKLI